MTGQQNAVMWLGITLIVLRLFSTGQWQAIWGTVAPAAAATKGTGGIGGCPKGQIMVDGKCLVEQSAAIQQHATTYPNTGIPT
jgi:hypothetical protein